MKHGLAAKLAATARYFSQLWIEFCRQFRGSHILIAKLPEFCTPTGALGSTFLAPAMNLGDQNSIEFVFAVPFSVARRLANHGREKMLRRRIDQI
jgi:hypothetical protein